MKIVYTIDGICLSYIAFDSNVTVPFYFLYYLDFPNPGDRDVYCGIQEINKGNYQEAQKYFEKGSNYDNEYASLFNALHYYTGFGFAKRDPSKAMNLFKKIALEWNNPVAQYLVGIMYTEGDQGICRHEKKGAKWLFLAAENNWSDAMSFLGFCYDKAILFKQDVQKSIEWFQKVAQKDDSETEPIEDGILYLFGNKEFELRLEEEEISFIKENVDEGVYSPGHYLGPLRNPVMAEWGERLNTGIWSMLTNKKSRGVVLSQIIIGSLCRQNDDGPKSAYFFKKAAKNGSAIGCMFTASAYEHGIGGLVQDYKEALKWYKVALEVHLEMEAAYCIGVFYGSAKGVKKDCRVALEYFTLSVSKNDHGCAYFIIAEIYEEGIDGVSQDYLLARRNFEKAFDCGQVDAAFSLARFYREGLGGIFHHKKYAIKWLSLAAENNWADAMALLGLCYQKGALFKRDFQKAEKWFQKVARKDNSETEPIENGIFYLLVNKDFELCLEEKDINIIKAIVDQEVYSPRHYLDRSRNPTMAEWCQKLFYTSIWSMLTNKKSRGVVTSQELIGYMYRTTKAEKNGSAVGCMLTANAYEYGASGIKDYKEALKWYKVALEAHLEIEAAYYIGTFYGNAKGVKRDCKVALEHFTLRVSGNDNGRAYLNMGIIYEDGKDGIPQDYILARQNFEKAFDCGQADDTFSLARLYGEGLGGIEDQKKSEEWTMKAITAKSLLDLTPPGLFPFRDETILFQS
ncbi:hypothetical protein HPULCUR_003918 [Helicostylum pulchrum]|uniref:Beta-lactamase n=1 Tax=Helicostylum pulchrum TaxID=562976 RepID=A0ABP9XUP8_9FUNG